MRHADRCEEPGGLPRPVPACSSQDKRQRTPRREWIDGNHPVHGDAGAKVQESCLDSGLGMARGRAGLPTGDGPKVYVRPSSLTRDYARRATSTGGKCRADVHAKSRLTLET